MSGQFDREPWRVALVLDGDSPIETWSCLLAPDAVVVAADGGVRHAQREGVAVGHLVGDLDSVSEAEITRLAEAGTAVHRYPTEKDETDFELAADLAGDLASGAVESAPRVLVIGGNGGRLDHLFGNLEVLAGPRFAAITVTALMGTAVVQVAHPLRTVHLYGGVDSLVSLYPVGLPAVGITTVGLQYALRDDTLVPGSARGTSNLVQRAPASVRLGTGVLLVIEPDAVTSLIQPTQEQR